MTYLFDGQVKHTQLSQRLCHGLDAAVGVGVGLGVHGKPLQLGQRVGQMETMCERCSRTAFIRWRGGGFQFDGISIHGLLMPNERA